MIKLILFVILCIILAVQAEYEIQIIGERDAFTFECDKPSAKWLHGVGVAYCKDCPSLPCTVHKNYTARIKAFCNKTNPIFHIDSTPVDFDDSFISCATQGLGNIHLRVGRYDGRLHSEKSTVALEQNNFTLVFDKRQDGYIHWYKQGQWLAGFDANCIEVGSTYDKNRFNITCEKDISKLYIKNVTLSDDGEIFACSEGGAPSLFRVAFNDTEILTGTLHLVLLLSLLSLSL